MSLIFRWSEDFRILCILLFTHVSIDSEDPTQATLKVEMVIGDVSMTDMNEAKKTGSGWCLLLKEKPMATALKFKRLFHL